MRAVSRASWPAKTRERNFVCFCGAIDPVSRRRCTNRWTHARLTANLAATSSASPLASHARTTRSRKSIEYGAIATSTGEEYHDRRTMYKSKAL
jgi:hypothetical protein